MEKRSFRIKSSLAFLAFIISTLLCFTVVNAENTAKPVLGFKADGTFKIAMFSDVQDGYPINQRTIDGINKVLTVEKPDFVMIAGDLSDGRIKNANDFKAFVKQLAEPMESRKIPWAHVYGNHDEDHVANSKLTAELQQPVYEAYTYCLSQRGPADVSGVGNYVIPVKSSDGNRIAFNIWGLDSNRYLDKNTWYNGSLGTDACLPNNLQGNSSYDFIKFSQIEWYWDTSVQMEKANGHKIPGLMFFHIPLPEFRMVSMNPSQTGMTEEKNETECNSALNGGLFSAILQRGDVKGVFCGHDHLNTYEGKYCGIRLGYDASLGYSDYGSDDLRGARIFLLNEANPAQFTTKMTRVKDLSAPAKKPVITLSGSTVSDVKQKISVTIKDGSNPTQGNDWIGLYEENVTPGSGTDAIWWKYLPELGITNGSGTFTFDPSSISEGNAGRYIPGGRYKFIIAYNDSYTVEANAAFAISKSAEGASITANADINNKTRQVIISGKISNGAGKEVSLIVKKPSNGIDYMDQTTSNEGGNYKFEYTLAENLKGEYKVKVGGEGVLEPAEAAFVYEPVTEIKSITAQAEVNNLTGLVTISGKISTGGGKEITLVVQNPSNVVDYTANMKSKDDGSFKFEYILDEKVKGEYKAKVSGEGIPGFAEVNFKYEPIIINKNITAQAEVNNRTGLVTISGRISTGGGKEITLVVKNPSNAVDYTANMKSKDDGSFKFEYTLDEKVKGEYKAKVSGEGVPGFAEVNFKYEPVTENKRITAQAEVNNRTGLVTISGRISTGGGKEITLVIKNPSNAVDYAANMKSKDDGSFKFEYTLDEKVKGEYKAKVSGEGIPGFAEVNFKYEPVAVSEPEGQTDNHSPAAVSEGDSTIIDDKLPKAKMKTTLNKDSGAAEAVVASDVLDKLFNKAQADDSGVKKVVLEVLEITGAKSYAAKFNSTDLTSTDNVKKQVDLRTSIANIVIPGNMFDGSALTNSKNIEISIGAVDKSTIDTSLKAEIGDRPVIDLGVTVDGKQVKWENKNAPVTISFKYKPSELELKDPEHIVVWYIGGSGKAVSIPSGRFDPRTGMVTFTTTHFSKYAVAFVNKTFGDINDIKWAKNEIEVLASKGIINGISGNAFGPASKIARADFIVYLVKALKLDASFDSNFSDVEKGKYYYEAVGIAKKLGIIAGTGNNTYEPEKPISRQDMMVIAARALSIAKNETNKGSSNELKGYKDASKVNSYAADSVAALINKGIIEGSSGNISPRESVTRSQAAVVIYKLYNLYN